MPVVVLDRLKTTLAHRYSLDRAIGRGGMATVYVPEKLKNLYKIAIAAPGVGEPVSW
jgi:hypothetical protein